MSEPGPGPSAATEPDISDSEELRESIRDQRARVRRLREDGADENEIRRAVDTLASLLSEVIITQSARVRKLKTNRAGKSRIAEAERRLEGLKAEFLADTGSEWSDMRAEGPVLLTTNEVRGSEVRPVLKLELKQLTRGNVLR